MIAELGHYALMLALGLAVIQGTMPIVGTRTNDPVLMSMAAPTALAQFAFVAMAFGALAICYVISDFSVLNVFENSNSQMPFIYRLTSIWGNHEGSMMLWVFILTFFGALVAVFGNNLPAVLKANALAVQAWIAAAFHLFILLTSNPFIRIPQAPFEGRDLNPILQDPGLAFHPPMLYLGHVGFSIAFSFAIAALLEGRIDAEENDSDYPTVQSLERYREDVFALGEKYLRNISVEELNTQKIMKTWGNRDRLLVPAEVILRTQMHLYHHQGQILAMCRLLGRPASGMDYPIE